MPPPPVVTLDDAQGAHMAGVDIRQLRVPGTEDLGDTSWDELYLAWAVHSRTHFGTNWKQVDGSNLMYSHVGSALHILRLQAVASQTRVATAA